MAKRLDKTIWLLLALWGLLSLLLPLFASAQSRADFMLKLNQARYGLLPSSWNVVLVGEGQWWDQCLRAGVITGTAYTYPDRHTTYLRESYAMTAPIKQLRHTMAHEAGHLACGCDSETVANAWARLHE
jgi:hypothetical protein